MAPAGSPRRGLSFLPHGGTCPASLIGSGMSYPMASVAAACGLYQSIIPRTIRSGKVHVGLNPSLGRSKSFLVRHSKDRVRQPAAERVVVLELFEELGVILEHRRDHPLEGLVVLDAGVLPVGVLPGVLVGRVG
jgi:hypothetical protein